MVSTTQKAILGAIGAFAVVTAGICAYKSYNNKRKAAAEKKRRKGDEDCDDDGECPQYGTGDYCEEAQNVSTREGASSNGCASEEKFKCSAAASSVLKNHTNGAEQKPYENALSLKDKGNKFFKLSNYAGALEFYTKAIEACPSSENELQSVLYNNRAACFDNLNEFDKAFDDCNSAISRNKTYLKGYYRRAKVCRSLRKFDQSFSDSFVGVALSSGKDENCVKLFDDVLSEAAKMKAAELMRTREYRVPSNSNIEQTYLPFTNDPIMVNIEKFSAKSVNESSPFEVACIKLREKDYGDIVELCTKELENPDSSFTSEALLLQGVFLQAGGKPAEAVENFTKLQTLDKTTERIRSNALVRKAAIELELGNRTEAFRSLDLAIAIDSENSDIYRMRCQFHMVFDNYAACVDDIRKARDLANSDPLCELQLAFLEFNHAMKIGNIVDVDNALKTMKNLKDQNSNQQEFILIYAQAYAMIGRIQEAYAAYEEAIDAFPKSADPLVALAKLGNPNDTMKLLKRAESIEPNHELVLQLLGLQYMISDEPDKAIAMYEKASIVASNELQLCQVCMYLEVSKAQLQVQQTFGIKTGKLLQSLL